VNERSSHKLLSENNRVHGVHALNHTYIPGGQAAHLESHNIHFAAIGGHPCAEFQDWFALWSILMCEVKICHDDRNKTGFDGLCACACVRVYVCACVHVCRCNDTGGVRVCMQMCACVNVSGLK